MRYTEAIKEEMKELEKFGFEQLKLYDDCDEGRYYDALKDRTKVEVWVNKGIKWRYFGAKTLEEVIWYEIDPYEMMAAEVSVSADIEIELEQEEGEVLLVTNVAIGNVDSDEVLENQFQDELSQAENEQEAVTKKVLSVAQKRIEDKHNTLEFESELPLVVADEEVTLRFQDNLPLVANDGQLTLLFEEDLPLVANDSDVTLKFVDELEPVVQTRK